MILSPKRFFRLQTKSRAELETKNFVSGRVEVCPLEIVLKKLVLNRKLCQKETGK